MLPPTIRSVSIAIIVATFVSIRYTELPFMLYIFFANTPFTLMLMLFSLSLDSVTRDSEDVLGQLLSYEGPYLRLVPRKARTEAMLRTRAMRAVYLHKVFHLFHQIISSPIK